MTKTKTKKRSAEDLPHYDVDKETGEPQGVETLIDLGSMSINENKVSVGFACALDPEKVHHA